MKLLRLRLILDIICEQPLRKKSWKIPQSPTPWLISWPSSHHPLILHFNLTIHIDIMEFKVPPILRFFFIKAITNRNSQKHQIWPSMLLVPNQFLFRKIFFTKKSPKNEIELKIRKKDLEWFMLVLKLENLNFGCSHNRNMKCPQVCPFSSLLYVNDFFFPIQSQQLFNL